MKDCKIVGLDIAKNIFHAVGINAHGKEVFRKTLKRSDVIAFFSSMAPFTIALESCASCHYWYRELSKLGHNVKLIAAQYVKPYVRRQKNDFNDARAIAEAASREDLPLVSPKNEEQQYIQSLLRVRASLIERRTADSNQLRSLLYEYGIVFPTGIKSLIDKVRDLLFCDEHSLALPTKELVNRLYDNLIGIEKEIAYYDKLLNKKAKESEKAKRLMRIPGVGVLGAMAVIANLGNPTNFKNGRHYSAYLGLVPRQASSGGKTSLGKVSKQGDVYLRQLLIHGARASLRYCDRYKDARSIKLQEMKKRMHINKVCVALANKNARIIWAMLATGKEYGDIAAA